ncbi:unnamed protein product [Phytophthora lilii]|uniref:Unnamed protein product n=1 Tax=Phytophthora lilii TaxID=2077276 RepID=A0A9W6TZQ9_9STRA|nr:unnamed protein product [Phytophthora lilii]
MDATEVIELLDDSSDTASPAVPPMRAPSDGYADVVQRALAVAAALETEKASAGKRQRGRPKVPPAPPLLSTKTKKPHVQPAAERRPAAPKPAVKPRSSWNTVTHRPARSRARSSSFSSSLSSSSDSDSSRSSGTHSRRRVGAQQVPRRPNGAVQPTPRRPSSAAQPSSATPFKTKRPLERRLKNNGVASRKRLKERRRGVAGVQAPAKNQQPAEVVDLLSSSSSSSDSSTGRRSRLSSQSSLSSDSDSPSLVPARSARKRLMLNDRVKRRSVSYPTPSSGPPARYAVAVSRPQFASVATNTTVVKPRGGSKRKRVLPHMRRETSGKKWGRAPRGQLVKETMKRKESTASGVRFGAPTLKAPAATHTSPLSLSSSSLSSSSSSAPSSPASSPRAVPSRKSVTTPLASADRYTREGDTDALGRSHCRKSASASSVPPRKVTSHSPPPARRASVSAVASPSPSPCTSPSPRKKRRVASHLYFDTDRVALDDLQAQERELARIRSQRKQTQARLRPSKPSGSKKKTPQEVICVDDHSDANSTAYSEEAMQDDGHHNQTEVKALATAEPAAADVSSRALFHPTSYRGVYFSEAPLNILSLQGQACSAPYESRCDHPLTFYGTIWLASFYYHARASHAVAAC